MAEVYLCLHVKTWTWIIAIVNFVLCVLGIITMVGALFDSGDSKTEDTWSSYLNIGIFAIWVLFVILLLVGLKQNKPEFIIPHMVVSGIVGLLEVAALVMAVVNGFNIWGFVTAFVTIVLIFFFLCMEWQCYKWMRDYQNVHSTY